MNSLFFSYFLKEKEKTTCVKATRMAPSSIVETSAISITNVDTNMMVVSHIKNSAQNLEAYRKI